MKYSPHITAPFLFPWVKSSLRRFISLLLMGAIAIWAIPRVIAGCATCAAPGGGCGDGLPLTRVVLLGDAVAGHGITPVFHFHDSKETRESTAEINGYGGGNSLKEVWVYLREGSPFTLFALGWDKLTPEELSANMGTAIAAAELTFPSGATAELQFILGEPVPEGITPDPRLPQSEPTTQPFGTGTLPRGSGIGSGEGGIVGQPESSPIVEPEPVELGFTFASSVNLSMGHTASTGTSNGFVQVIRGSPAPETWAFVGNESVGIYASDNKTLVQTVSSDGVLVFERASTPEGTHSLTVRAYSIPGAFVSHGNAPTPFTIPAGKSPVSTFTFKQNSPSAWQGTFSHDGMSTSWSEDSAEQFSEVRDSNGVLTFCNAETGYRTVEIGNSRTTELAVVDESLHNGRVRRRLETSVFEKVQGGAWVKKSEEVITQEGTATHTVNDAPEFKVTAFRTVERSQRLVPTASDPANPNEFLTTYYEYYSEAEAANDQPIGFEQGGGVAGALKVYYNNRGEWERYEYTVLPNGTPVRYRISPWLDGPASYLGATFQNSVVERVEGSPTLQTMADTTVSRFVAGVLVEKSITSRESIADPDSGQFRLRETVKQYAGTALSSVSAVESVNAAWMDSPSAYGTGRLVSRQTIEGTDNATGDEFGARTTYDEVVGVSPSSAELLGGELGSAPSLVGELVETAYAGDGTALTRSATLLTVNGRLGGYRQEWDKEISVWRTLSTEFNEYHPESRKHILSKENGIVTHSVGRLTDEPSLEIVTDKSGQEIVRSRIPSADGVSITTILGSPAGTLPGIDLAYAEQPDRSTSVHIAGDPNFGITRSTDSSSSVFDLTGRIISSTDNTSLITTTHTYFADGLTEIVTQSSSMSPNSVTTVTEYYRDGQLKSITGDVETEEHHSYAVDAQGRLTETVHYGPHSASTPSPRWTKTVTDGLGRTLQQIRPAAPDSGTAEVVTDFFYDAAGRITRTVASGEAPQITVFENGEAVRSGVALDSDLTLPLDSALNPTTVTRREFEEDTDGLWRVTTQKTLHNAAGDASHVRKTRTLIDIATGRQVREDIVQAHGGTQVTRSETTFDPMHKLTITTVSKPGTTAVQKTATVNGLDIASWVQDGATAKLVSKSTYDVEGRLATDTTYSSEGVETVDSYSAGIFLSRLIAGQLSPFQLYGPSEVGKAGLIAVDEKGVNFAYDNLGRLTLQWGSSSTWQNGAYPVQHEYDAYGQRHKMHTYRSKGFLADFQWELNPLIQFASEPSDQTTWNYDPATGLLTSKTDAAGESVSYTYYPDGALRSRQWARGETTTYEYDDAGRPTLVSYSGGNVTTPWTKITYHRDGTIDTLIDGAGLHTFNEDANGTTESVTMAPAPETPAMPISGSLLAGLATTYGYDTKGRRQSASVQFAAPAAGAVWSASYGYDGALGRLQTASFGGIGSWEYGYHDARSPAIHHLIGPGGLRQDRRRPSSASAEQVWYSAAGQTVMGWHYNLDTTGKRTLAAPYTAQGTSSGPGNVRPSWTYGYNRRGEVASAEQFATEPGGYTVLPNRHWLYQYDAIGNRVNATEGGLTTTYTTNELNQYTQIDHPRSVSLRGTSVVTPKVDGALADYVSVAPSQLRFQVPLTAATAAAEQKAVVVEGIHNGAVISRRSSSVFIPAAITLPAYDADGNLTNDGRWIYTWDGENRLVQMDTTPQAVAAGAPSQKLEFAYDHRSRRISKKVSEDLSGTWRLTQWRKYLYDGWNMIAELDALSDHAIVRTYAWGIDLGGSVDGEGGAGGVGALLAVKRQGRGSAKTWSALNDANGNISGWWDIATQTLTAQMEYDPFGNLIHDSTPEGLEISAVGFSSKWQDRESGFQYFGYRLYSPAMGRWLNRDPIEEEGGINLYGMVANDAVNSVDVLGLWKTDIHHQLIEGWLDSRPADKGTWAAYKWRCGIQLNVAAALKLGNDTLDGDVGSGLEWGVNFLNAQASALAYQHAMRSEDETVSQARAKYRAFIDKEIRDAKFSAMLAQNALNNGDSDLAKEIMVTAIVHIGFAQHSTADNFSPAHKGFQIWYGPGRFFNRFGDRGGAWDYVRYVQRHSAKESSYPGDGVATQLAAKMHGHLLKILR